MNKTKLLTILLGSGLLFAACNNKQNTKQVKSEQIKPKVAYTEDGKDTLYVLGVDRSDLDSIKVKLIDKRGFESFVVREKKHPVLKWTEHGDTVVVYFELCNKWDIVENITQKHMKENWLKGNQR